MKSSFTSLASAFFLAGLLIGGAASAQAPQPEQIVEACTSVGLTPENVAMADAAGQTAAILARIAQSEQLVSDRQVLRQQASQVADEVTRLTNELREGSENDDVLVELQAKKAQLISLRQSIVDNDAALFATATDGMSPEAVDRLQRARAAQLRRVPPSFRMLALTDDEWKQVEKDLRREAYADQTGQALDPNVAQRLAQIRANAEVMRAEQDLADDLEAVRTQFASFTS